MLSLTREPLVKRYSDISVDKSGAVSTARIHPVTCRMRRLRHRTLPISLQRRRCLVVSLQEQQLGHVSPRWAKSFCLDRYPRTADTPYTCLPANNWNIFGMLWRVLWSAFQATSSKASVERMSSRAKSDFASCLCT